jgi:RES domain-containing protein
MSGMTEFATVYGYLNFERSVKQKARYIHDEQTRIFLKTVMETSESRRKTLQKDQILWRAQRGFERRMIKLDNDDEIETEGAYPAERMVPKAEYVGEGRVNTVGIPCLYLASNQRTAMSEVRPWVGSYVSLAQFKVMRDCEVVDCSMDKKRSILSFSSTGELKEPDAAGREAGVWGEIGQAFSKPVTLGEPHCDYAPTQILAEAFRGHGYGGIVYNSLLDREGLNIALFDLTAAEPINCGLHQTRSVVFEFNQTGDPYFIEKQYPEMYRGIPKDETTPAE